MKPNSLFKGKYTKKALFVFVPVILCAIIVCVLAVSLNDRNAQTENGAGGENPDIMSSERGDEEDMDKLYERINFEDAPSKKTPLNGETLNKMDSAINDLDNRVIETHDELKNNLSEMEIKILSECVVISTGKNKFNKSSTNRLNGCNTYTNGLLDTNESYNSVIIPINGGETLVCNYAYVYLSFLSTFNDLSKKSVGDKLDGFIKRVVPAKVGEMVAVPLEAKYVCVSIQPTREDYLQIEYGTEVTAYEEYKEFLSVEIEDKSDKSELFVGADCTYKTIQDAVDNAKDGDTIRITSGTYNEAVCVCGSTGNINTSAKEIAIVGFNRDACILTHDIGDYYLPPLEIAKGRVENLTIIGTGTEYAEGSTHFAYCVHADYDTSRNASLQFVNCRFKNTVYPCVGAATRGGFKLSFVNCIFECDTSAAMLFHEEQANDVTNQHIEFIDCIFVSNSPTDGTIHVQESGTLTGNKVELTFARCIVKNTNTGLLARRYVNPSGDSSEGSGWLNTRIYQLTPLSMLNSDELFNN
jgi:hypothetical protein